MARGFCRLFAAVAVVLAAVMPAAGSGIETILEGVPREGAPFDFTRAALALSRIADPVMDTAWCEDEINAMAEEIRPGLEKARSAGEKIAAVNRVLFESRNFKFDETANSYAMRKRFASGRIETANYESFERVLRDRRGICVSFSLLYIMLAEKLGLPVYPVFMPGHVFVRYEGRDGRVNIETTAEGQSAADSYYLKNTALTGKAEYSERRSQEGRLSALFWGT